MTTLEILLSTILPLIFSATFAGIAHLNRRISEMDVRLRNVVSDKDVRILINDKIDPIKEDIHEIKQKLDKLIELREKK